MTVNEIKIVKSITATKDQLYNVLGFGLSEKELIASLKELIEQEYIKMTYCEDTEIYQIDFLDHPAMHT